MALCIYIDGGARGNPGPAAAGVLIHEGNPSAPLHEGGYFLGHMTNNMAEYKGLLIALELAVQTGDQDIAIHSDSQLLVRQIEGKYRVQSSLLKPLYERAKHFLKQFAHWKITHIRREFNKRADQLANLAMDAGEDVLVVPLVPEHLASDPNGEPIASKPETEPRKWTAQRLDDPGPDCPVSAATHNEFTFGPTTPAQCCIYAARAILDEITAPKGQLPLTPCQTQCQRCGVAIAVKPVT